MKRKNVLVKLRWKKFSPSLIFSKAFAQLSRFHDWLLERLGVMAVSDFASKKKKKEKQILA